MNNDSRGIMMREVGFVETLRGNTGKYSQQTRLKECAMNTSSITGGKLYSKNRFKITFTGQAEGEEDLGKNLPDCIYYNRHRRYDNFITWWFSSMIVILIGLIVGMVWW